MSLTQNELQNQFLQARQSEAAHLIALMESVVDGRLQITNTNISDIEAKINAVNTLLDGDPSSEGFQKFIALTTKIGQLETQSAEQQTAINSLLSTINNHITDVTARINQVEKDGQDARNALSTQLTQLEATVTAAAQARLTKDNEHDGKLADHETRIAANETKNAQQDQRLTDLESGQTTQNSDINALKSTAQNLENALNDEATARLAGDKTNADKLVIEQGRIDTLSTQAQTFATRQNVADAGLAGSNAFVAALWAGRTMPSGLLMPDGSVSA